MENILPRREARENAFLLAFSQTFGDVPLAEAILNHEENDEDHPVDGFSKHLLNAYYDHSAEVDDEIRAHLRNWTMERLPRVSLTVLRLAVAEMLFGGENKPGVAINEAVELTKKYGADEDYQFVNGLLGAVARDHGLNDEAAAESAEQLAVIRLGSTRATMQPLWRCLTQPERLFVQRSAFCRSRRASLVCGRAMRCSTTRRPCRRCCSSLHRSST